MKKMIMMAIAATMTMVMSVNANAATASPIDLSTVTESNVAPATQEVLSSRVMISDQGNRLNKFVYIIGADGTVLSKTMYTNNKKDNHWEPVCIYRAVYGQDSNQLYYASWDKEAMAYNTNATAISYTKEECPVLMRLPEVVNY